MIPIRAKFVYDMITPNVRRRTCNVFKRSTGLSPLEAFYLWCNTYSVDPKKAKQVYGCIKRIYIG